MGDRKGVAGVRLASSPTRGVAWPRAALAVLLIAVLALAGVPPRRALAAAGELDPDFGQGGKITTTFGGPAEARALAMQPDGMIVAAGAVSTRSGPSIVLGEAEGKSVSIPRFLPGDFAVARYRPDGTLDGEFGLAGRATTDFGGYDEALAVFVQPDGKLLVAGSTAPAETDEFGGMVRQSGPADVALARYNLDGTPDLSFGSGGKVVTDLGGDDAAAALAIQPDGKIVIAGKMDPTHPGPYLKPPYAVGNIALIRYNIDGTSDPTFGTGGTLITRLPSGPAAANALVLQPDGKLVVAGDAVTSGEYAQSEGVFFRSGDLVLIRYTGDGALDESFGTDGVVRLPRASAHALVLQPDGKLVTAGLMLVRFSPDGTVDTSFGSFSSLVGTVDPRWSEGVTALALQADGKLVAAAIASVPSRPELAELPSGAFGVFRYNPDGSPDSSFGSEGMMTTAFGEEGFPPDIPRAVALQEDGKIVAAGMVKTGESVSQGEALGFGLARYKVR